MGNQNYTTRICKICGKAYQVPMKHWQYNHKDKLSYDEFMAQELGLPEVPKCIACGNPVHFTRGRFPDVCDNPECQMKTNSTAPHAKMKICSICDEYYKSSKKHWESKHQDISYIKFKALELGYDDIPKCSICGKDALWDEKRPGFHETCGSYECEAERKHRKAHDLMLKYNHIAHENAVKNGHPALVKAREIGRASQKEKGEPSIKRAAYKKLIKRYGEDYQSFCYIIGYWNLIVKKYVFKVGFTTNLNARRDYLIKYGLQERKVLVVSGTLSEMYHLEMKVHMNPNFRKFSINQEGIPECGDTEWYDPICFKDIKQFFIDLGYNLQEYTVKESS